MPRCAHRQELLVPRQGWWWAGGAGWAGWGDASQLIATKDSPLPGASHYFRSAFDASKLWRRFSQRHASPLSCRLLHNCRETSFDLCPHFAATHCAATRANCGSSRGASARANERGGYFQWLGPRQRHGSKDNGIRRALFFWSRVKSQFQPC